MYYVQQFLEFCVKTNLIVAVSAFCLYKTTEILFQFHNFHLGCFVFFATLFTYNYMRVLDSYSFDFSAGGDYIFCYKKIILSLLFVSAVLIVYLIYILGVQFLQLITPVAVISLLYPISFTVNSATYSLRSIPFLKIFLISLVWSYVTVLLPILYYSSSLDYVVLDVFFQRFLFIIAISIPFDIRDMYIDQIKTFPNTIGVYESKLFAWFCLFLIDLLLIIDLINSIITVPVFCALFITIEITSIIIYFSGQNKSFMFYGIIVEGLSIIMCLFVLTAKLF